MKLYWSLGCGWPSVLLQSKQTCLGGKPLTWITWWSGFLSYKHTLLSKDLLFLALKRGSHIRGQWHLHIPDWHECFVYWFAACENWDHFPKSRSVTCLSTPYSLKSWDLFEHRRGIQDTSTHAGTQLAYSCTSNVTSDTCNLEPQLHACFPF